MNIILIHQAFTRIDEPGGTRHHEFARYLAQQGHRVTVLAGPESYLTGEKTPGRAASEPEVDDAGVRIIRCAAYGGWHRSFFQRVISFLSFSLSSIWQGLLQPKPDLVWGTSPPLFQAASAWLLARLKGTRFMLEIRDLWPRFAVEVGVLRSGLLIGVAEWLEAFLYRQAHLLVINSPGFFEHVLARGGKRVVVIPNGVDLEMFSKEDEPGRRPAFVPLSQDSFVVIYAGAHGLSNDLQVALQAAWQLRADRIKFVFVGDGKEKRTLRRTARAMGLENVRFLAPVPKVEMANMLARANAGLAILKPLEGYKTTYPNKVFDYMAAGLPVVLGIDGVIREVVEGAGAGVFAQPGDPLALAEAIRSLAADSDGAAEMGRRGRAHVEQHFSRRKLAAELERQIQRVMSEYTR